MNANAGTAVCPSGQPMCRETSEQRDGRNFQGGHHHGYGGGRTTGGQDRIMVVGGSRCTGHGRSQKRRIISAMWAAEFQQRAANRFTPWWHKMFSRLPSASFQKVVRMRNEYWNTQPNGQRQLREMANSSMDRLYGVVYGIVFLPTRRIYVGQTITSLWRRFQEHLWHRF